MFPDQTIAISFAPTLFNYGGLAEIQSALFHHLVVSSVDFDVIFCWFHWSSWFLTQLGYARNTNGPMLELRNTGLHAVLRFSENAGGKIAVVQ